MGCLEDGDLIAGVRPRSKAEAAGEPIPEIQQAGPSIDPETAAGLASNLRAALPRIRELLGLLTRRGKEDG